MSCSPAPHSCPCSLPGPGRLGLDTVVSRLSRDSQLQNNWRSFQNHRTRPTLQSGVGAGILEDPASETDGRFTVSSLPRLRLHPVHCPPSVGAHALLAGELWEDETLPVLTAMSEGKKIIRWTEKPRQSWFCSKREHVFREASHRPRPCHARSILPDPLHHPGRHHRGDLRARVPQHLLPLTHWVTQ